MTKIRKVLINVFILNMYERYKNVQEKRNESYRKYQVFSLKLHVGQREID